MERGARIRAAINAWMEETSFRSAVAVVGAIGVTVIAGLAIVIFMLTAHGPQATATTVNATHQAPTTDAPSPTPTPAPSPTPSPSPSPSPTASTYIAPPPPTPVPPTSAAPSTTTPSPQPPPTTPPASPTPIYQPSYHMHTLPPPPG